jgi:thiamine biosynthesis lipoprotein
VQSAETQVYPHMMGNSALRRATFRVLFGAIVLAWLLPWATTEAGWIRLDDAIMGTQVRVELWHEDPSEGRAAAEAVLDELRRIDREMSPYRAESELSVVNRKAARAPVTISRELLDLLTRAREFSELTNGAFDVTFASAGHLYDYRKHRHPDDEALQAALPAIDYRHVILDASAGTVRFSRDGVRIDLGGIAKGHAVDRGIALLEARGIHNALISAGGDTRVIGKRWGRAWQVGIRNPRDRQGLVAMIPLEDAAVSTSGDYERYFVEDGIRYHHILNPHTGRSAGEVRSVTIIGTDATTTDALSTSVFVLGPSKGLALVERLEGIEAVVVDREGVMRYSSGIEALGRAKPVAATTGR